MNSASSATSNYYGFDFYIAKEPVVFNRAFNTPGPQLRQWSEESVLAEKGTGSRVVFIAKSGKLFNKKAQV